MQLSSVSGGQTGFSVEMFRLFPVPLSSVKNTQMQHGISPE